MSHHNRFIHRHYNLPQNLLPSISSTSHFDFLSPSATQTSIPALQVRAPPDNASDEPSTHREHPTTHQAAADEPTSSTSSHHGGHHSSSRHHEHSSSSSSTPGVFAQPSSPANGHSVGSSSSSTSVTGAIAGTTVAIAMVVLASVSYYCIKKHKRPKRVAGGGSRNMKRDTDTSEVWGGRDAGSAWAFGTGGAHTSISRGQRRNTSQMLNDMDGSTEMRTADLGSAPGYGYGSMASPGFPTAQQEKFALAEKDYMTYSDPPPLPEYPPRTAARSDGDRSSGFASPFTEAQRQLSHQDSHVSPPTPPTWENPGVGGGPVSRTASIRRNDPVVMSQPQPHPFSPPPDPVLSPPPPFTRSTLPNYQEPPSNQPESFAFDQRLFGGGNNNGEASHDSGPPVITFGSSEYPRQEQHSSIVPMHPLNPFRTSDIVLPRSDAAFSSFTTSLAQSPPASTAPHNPFETSSPAISTATHNPFSTTSPTGIGSTSTNPFATGREMETEKRVSSPLAFSNPLPAGAPTESAVFQPFTVSFYETPTNIAPSSNNNARHEGDSIQRGTSDPSKPRPTSRLPNGVSKYSDFAPAKPSPSDSSNNPNFHPSHSFLPASSGESTSENRVSLNVPGEQDYRDSISAASIEIDYDGDDIDETRAPAKSNNPFALPPRPPFAQSPVLSANDHSTTFLSSSPSSSSLELGRSEVTGSSTISATAATSVNPDSHAPANLASRKKDTLVGLLGGYSDDWEEEDGRTGSRASAMHKINQTTPPELRSPALPGSSSASKVPASNSANLTITAPKGVATTSGNSSPSPLSSSFVISSADSSPASTPPELDDHGQTKTDYFSKPSGDSSSVKGHQPLHLSGPSDRAANDDSSRPSSNWDDLLNDFGYNEPENSVATTLSTQTVEPPPQKNISQGNGGPAPRQQHGRRRSNSSSAGSTSKPIPLPATGPAQARLISTERDPIPPSVTSGRSRSPASSKFVLSPVSEGVELPHFSDSEPATAPTHLPVTPSAPTLDLQLPAGDTYSKNKPVAVTKDSDKSDKFSSATLVNSYTEEDPTDAYFDTLSSPIQDKGSRKQNESLPHLEIGFHPSEPPHSSDSSSPTDNRSPEDIMRSFRERRAASPRNDDTSVRSGTSIRSKESQSKSASPSKGTRKPGTGGGFKMPPLASLGPRPPPGFAQNTKTKQNNEFGPLGGGSFSSHYQSSTDDYVFGS